MNEVYKADLLNLLELIINRHLYLSKEILEANSLEIPPIPIENERCFCYCEAKRIWRLLAGKEGVQKKRKRKNGDSSDRAVSRVGEVSVRPSLTRQARPPRERLIEIDPPADYLSVVPEQTVEERLESEKPDDSRCLRWLAAHLQSVTHAEKCPSGLFDESPLRHGIF